MSKKRNVSGEVIRDRKSTKKIVVAYARRFLRSKNLKRSYKKIRERIKKRSRRYINDYASIERECSRKSQKAHRHRISPDTSS